MANRSSLLAQLALTVVLLGVGTMLYFAASANFPQIGAWLLFVALTWCAGLAIYNIESHTSTKKRQALIHRSLRLGVKGKQKLDVLFWVVDRKMRVVEVGGAGLGQYATSPSQMMGWVVTKIPGFNPQSILDLERALRGEILIADYEHAGQVFRTQYFPSTNIFGLVTHVVCTTVNVSAINKLDAELTLANAVIDHASDAIVVADQRRQVVSVNAAFTALTGYEPDEVIGRKTTVVPAVSGFSYRDLRNLAFRLKHTGLWTGEVSARRKDGQPYIARLTVSLIREGGITSHYLFCFSDISDIKQRQDELHHLANHDFLTGLPNRRLFLDRLDQAVKRARRQDKRFALYFIDINDFKLINDTLGHQAGDMVLSQVAKRLVEVVREMDTVARLAGDEFVVLVEQVLNDDEIVEIGLKIQDSFDIPLDSGKKPIKCSASIGIAIFPQDGHSRDILLAIADAGMYRAKRLGHNDFFFQGRAHGNPVSSVSVQPVELSRAISMDEFELHYQPQIELKSDRIVGCEVLVRWNHSTGQQLLPSHFLPLAESQSMVRPIGYWIVKRAISQFSQWRSKGVYLDFLSINLAADQLDDEELGALVESMLDLGLIRPEQLRFEVSVQIAVEQPDMARAFFAWASELGVGCVLDDFGVLAEGFDLLHILAIDAVKLNRSLIQDSKGSGNAKAVIAAINALGRERNFAVVGVGVEQETQVESLHRSGCHLVQGYYYAPSLSDQDFTRFFQSYHRRTGS